MPDPDPIAVLTTRWLEKASGDLRAAATLLDDRGQNDPWTACFHVEQAVEKYLKAILVANGLEVPYTHNLVALKALVPTGWDVQVPTRDLARLTDCASTSRYAFSDVEFDTEPSWAEVEVSFEAAKELQRSVLANMAENGIELPTHGQRRGMSD